MNCEKENCSRKATFHFVYIASRRIQSEVRMCEAHAQSYLNEYRAHPPIGQGVAHAMEGAASIDLQLLVYHESEDAVPACVYLREVGGQRAISMMIDGWAWWALFAHLRPRVSDRLMTHMVWGETIKQMRGHVKHVIVADFDELEQWYLASLVLGTRDGDMSISVRPSDAFVLALRFGAPMFIIEDTLVKSMIRST